MKPNLRIVNLVAVVLLLMFSSTGDGHGQEVPSPEDFFGFEMGADRKLARWDKLVEYYEILDEASDRIRVVDMGPSTLGNPFLSIFVSAPENLANLNELKRMNALLSDPRGASLAEIDYAIENSKVVFVQSYGLHATEVAASQAAAEIVYEFVVREDDQMYEILDNTLGIIIPSFNPDGEIMVTDWYNEYVGTEYEGVGPPSLYHHYIGHDNNRDAVYAETVESRYGAEIIFREWIPQGYIDHHQMGPYTARIYLPPYAEPVRPEADPLVWREMSWYGAHMAYKQEEHNLSGAINAAIYSGWGHFGFHWITPFHNIAGMLTESASARLATPLYVHPDQLGGSRALPEYAEQTTFPNPWPGGWWHVRDIVERQKVATFAPLEIAAKNRKTVLKNAYLKASRQVQRGIEGSVKAYIIPSQQHDPLTMKKMVNKLLAQGITVEESPTDFVQEGRYYDSGTYVVSMAQPKRGVIRWLLGQTFYPDNYWTRDNQGQPIRPYDMSTDNIAEFMGVIVNPTSDPVSLELRPVTDSIDHNGTVTVSSDGYVLDGRLNDSFKATNMLFELGASVERVDSDGISVKAGDFLVSSGVSSTEMSRVAEETGVDFKAVDAGDASVAKHILRQQRIGLFQRYLGGNIDEGWTRLLLENFGFPYETLMDEELLSGNLEKNWDVIVLPADGLGQMTGEVEGSSDEYPPQYRSGFGDAGVDALRRFVQGGGTLVTFSQAGDLPIKEFDLPVRNAVEGMSGNEFWSPGSTLKVKVDRLNPLGYGMPEDAWIAFMQGGQVYETIAGARSSNVHRVSTYLNRDILQSGWLLGEEKIAEKASMVSVKYGAGSVVLIGFRPQHRTQTHGTFKFFFNALVNTK
jgi:hypothetical protein